MEQSSFKTLRRKWNGFKTHPLGGKELAEQLTYYESRLYRAVSSKELLAWLSKGSMKDKTKEVQNLSKFIATLDRLAAWVKESILKHEDLQLRVTEIQRWMAVAEVVSPNHHAKCNSFGLQRNATT